MNNNLNKVAKDLYGKIQTRFSDIKMGDENAEVLGKKSDIPNARFFEFEYEEGEKPLGTIVITLDEEDGIVIQLGGELEMAKSTHSLNQFIKSFRQFAKTRMLNFDVQNIGKSNLDKRDYQFQAKPKELQIMESKMFGTNRISYQHLGETRLVVKHNQEIDPTMAGSRSMHIQSIFIENSEGERFKFPFIYLPGARAMQRHVANQDNPYDNFGQYIVSLSEQIYNLRKFNHLVSRHAFLENTEIMPIADAARSKLKSIKRTLESIQKQRGYENVQENFTAFEKTDRKSVV